MASLSLKTIEAGRDVMRELFTQASAVFKVSLRVPIPYEDEVIDQELSLFIERRPEALAAYVYPSGDLVFETQGRFQKEGASFEVSLHFTKGDTDPEGATVTLPPESIEEARRILEG